MRTAPALVEVMMMSKHPLSSELASALTGALGEVIMGDEEDGLEEVAFFIFNKVQEKAACLNQQVHLLYLPVRLCNPWWFWTFSLE